MSIEKPKGKVCIKATGVNRYMGGDSNWHLITGYEYECTRSNGVKEIRATFTWQGERNGIGVSLFSDGGAFLCKDGETLPLMAKKDSPSGQPITLQHAYKIITGT